MRKIVKKMKVIFFCLLLATLLFPVNVYAESIDLGTYSWEGQWESNWGDMVITQQGARVTGTYTHDSGRISGTVSGDVFTGTWSESPSYAPDNDAGDMELVMSADGMSFTGKWRYGSSGSWGSWEGAKRTTPIKYAPVVENPTDNGNNTMLELQVNNKMMKVNGVQTEIDPGKETVPAIINGRTLIPIRAVMEALGGTVGYDATDQKITLKKGSDTLDMWIGETGIRLNGSSKNMDVAPMIINGRTMVPVRFVAENFGYSVEWKEAEKKIIIQ